MGSIEAFRGLPAGLPPTRVSIAALPACVLSLIYITRICWQLHRLMLFHPQGPSKPNRSLELPDDRGADVHSSLSWVLWVLRGLLQVAKIVPSRKVLHRLQQVGTWVWHDLCRFSFFLLLRDQRTVIFHLSGSYCNNYSFDFHGPEVGTSFTARPQSLKEKNSQYAHRVSLMIHLPNFVVEFQCIQCMRCIQSTLQLSGPEGLPRRRSDVRAGFL